jgi:hypothetical protein
MMVLGIATALVIVAVALPGRLPAPPEHIVVPRQLASEPADAAAVAQVPPPAPARAAATTSAAVAPVRTPAKKTIASTPRPNRAAESANAAPAEAAAVTPAEPEPRTAAPAPAAVAGPAPVTITGCLEMSVDQTEFRLTDTDGADAPKSRSWRSGFLKKRSAPIELLDAQDAHALVGKRVAATGLLTSGSMKVSALRLVTPSCS